MLKHRASRLTVAVLAAAAVIVVAGSVATASNMGFKLNKALARPVVGAGVESGNNWTSIPYRNPYSGGTCNYTVAPALPAGTPCVSAFCSQTGLPPLATTVFQIEPVTGGPINAACGSATGNNTALVPGRGVQIRGTTLPASIIIVGSHDPAQVITIPAISKVTPLVANQGNLWFAVPYHTTAVSAADLCTQSGMGNLTGTVRTVNAGAATGTTVSCGTPTAATLILRLGEAARLRDSSIAAGAVKTFIPAHF